MKNYLPDTCLVSPLHDPDGRVAQLVRTYGKELKRYYFGAIHIRVTKNTNPATLKALDSSKIAYSVQGSNGNFVSLGRTYKEAISSGIKLKTRHIHVCDFDRALHWAKSFPNELRDILELLPANYGLTWIGRTKRAFETHPKTQRETESIVNIIASKVAGFEIDIMAGSFALDATSAKSLLKESTRNDYTFLSEFVVIAMKKKIPMYSLITEGLEWETPDQYSDKIRREGYNDWLDEFMSLPEWKRRIELMEGNSDVLIGKGK